MKHFENKAVRFEIPPGWEDGSSIRFEGPRGGAPFAPSVVFTREITRADVLTYALEQVVKLTPKLDGATLSSVKTTSLGGLPACELDMEWETPEGPVKQRRTFFRHEKKMWTMTASASRGMFEQASATFAKIAGSVVLGPPAAPAARATPVPERPSLAPLPPAPFGTSSVRPGPFAAEPSASRSRPPSPSPPAFSPSPMPSPMPSLSAPRVPSFSAEALAAARVAFPPAQLAPMRASAPPPRGPLVEPPSLAPAAPAPPAPSSPMLALGASTLPSTPPARPSTPPARPSTPSVAPASSTPPARPSTAPVMPTPPARPSTAPVMPTPATRPLPPTPSPFAFGAKPARPLPPSPSPFTAPPATSASATAKPASNEPRREDDATLETKRMKARPRPPASGTTQEKTALLPLPLPTKPMAPPARPSAPPAPRSEPRSERLPFARNDD